MRAHMSGLDRTNKDAWANSHVECGLPQRPCIRGAKRRLTEGGDEAEGQGRGDSRVATAFEDVKGASAMKLQIPERLRSGNY
jgi:hypothetical protein